MIGVDGMDKPKLDSIPDHPYYKLQFIAGNSDGIYYPILEFDLAETHAKYASKKTGYAVLHEFSHAIEGQKKIFGRVAARIYYNGKFNNTIEGTALDNYKAEPDNNDPNPNFKDHEVIGDTDEVIGDTDEGLNEVYIKAIARLNNNE
jgi:hypothetical protein